MKIAIIYASVTGNTKMVAESIKESLKKENIIYFGPVTKDNIDADLFVVGSWTNRGTATNEIINFLKQLENKKIAFFGTAGYGGSEEYYQTLFNRVKENISSSNLLLGYFYCQGKMPLGVRERYISMIKANPADANLLVSLENFDEALTHPDDKDLENAKNWIKEIIKKGGF